MFAAVICVITMLGALLSRGTAAQSEPVLRCQSERCQYLGGNMYQVEGNKIHIGNDEGSLTMICYGASVLQSRELPRAEPALLVYDVQLQDCPLPTHGSLMDTLITLHVMLECNVSHATAGGCDTWSGPWFPAPNPCEVTTSKPTSVPPGKACGDLTLMLLPREPPLNASHFIGLSGLIRLRIKGIEDKDTQPSPEHGFLLPLQSLQSLEISYVLLKSGMLDDLPLSLRKLAIDTVDGMERLPEAPMLESFKGYNWMKLQPVPLVRCNSLKKLDLNILTPVNDLPDGWLMNCSRMETLYIVWSKRQTTLPAKLLLGAQALVHLSFTGASLETLPEGLLDHSPNLRWIQLKYNNLQTLPSSIFSGTFGVARRMQWLDLSWNKLDNRVMRVLEPLENLTGLDLSYNEHIGDVCNTDGYSAIRNFTKLAKLKLLRTGVTNICKDWRDDMTLLAMLDLRMTNVSQLLFKDLQFTRSVEAMVMLPSASLATVEITREDYNDPARKLPSGAIMYPDEMFECDCKMYWTRRALDLPQLQHVDGLRCLNNRQLRHVSAEDLWCARPNECSAAEMPHACLCSARPDHDSSHARRLVRVRCERAALSRVPRPRVRNDNVERRYELLLANNNISEIRANELHNIKELDLRNNILSRVDEETASRLGSIEGMLRLSGNPLDCSCRNAPMLRALHARNETKTDLTDATCSNGSKLYTAFTLDCGQGSPADTSLFTWLGLAGGLAAVLAVALLITAVFASRERRFFARAVLHRWGFEWRADEPEDRERHYDAFVTFSHKDEAVVYELMARLEPAYRLCIHARDWVPGGYIVEQISRSVCESRRTLALVSRHFLASSWACAEFREAHTAAMLEARPRLVVIMLEEPAALELDDQLRRYVATQTYLRWGDPWFWNKLAVALPRPRTPPPSPSASTSDQPDLELAPAPATRVTTTPGTDVSPS